MSTKIISWKEAVGIDTSIEKINIYEYELHQGTRLNDVGHIRVTINNEDQFIHPSHSHLYIEEELAPTVGKKYAIDECGISLVSNGRMFLCNCIDYDIANKKIEGFNNPGRATTMKELLTYRRIYPEGMGFLWSLAENPGIAENDGYGKRCQYIKLEGNGSFSAKVSLSHIFGFCEQYDKVRNMRSPSIDPMMKKLFLETMRWNGKEIRLRRVGSLRRRSAGRCLF